MQIDEPWGNEQSEKSRNIISVIFRSLSVWMTTLFLLCDRLVYADDTNRVIHVTKRFFSFFMILVTVHIASRTKQKGL